MPEWPSKLKGKGQLCLAFLFLFYGLILLAAPKSICRQQERAQGELEFRFVFVSSHAASQGINKTLTFKKKKEWPALTFSHTYTLDL